MRRLRCMIPTSAEGNFTAKQEGNTVINDGRKNYFSEASCNNISTPWPKLKDPRIVRVSRASGGKDRHSKVFTMRGLIRDRRVRLSVPTAIQLYDLQERLGLNQPSKVVDWLLDAAKHEIDELPPLQMPPAGNFSQNHQPFLSTDHGGGGGPSQSIKEGFKINNSMDWDDPLGLSRSNFWILDANLRDKSKEFATETADEEEKQGNLEAHGPDVSSNNFFPRPSSHSFIPDLLNNVMPSNSFDRWDASNFSSSQLGSHGYAPQTEDLLNFNIAVPALPSSTLSLASGSHVLVYPPAGQSYFPNSHAATSVEFDEDPKQINHFQMLSSSSTNQNPLSNSLAPTLYSLGQSMRRPLHFSMDSKLLPSQDGSTGSQSNNNAEFSSK